MPPNLSRSMLPWALLTVSVALNAFFIGGHVYGRFYPDEVYGEVKLRPALAERQHAIAEELALAPEQEQALGDLRRQVAEQGKALRERNREAAEALWREMGAAAPDERRMESLIRSMADSRLTFQLEASRLTRQFMTQLDPQQRAQFVQLARSKRLFLEGPDGRLQRLKYRLPPGEVDAPAGAAKE